MEQRGFTLIELLLASLILIVGIAAVMELVPRAMQLNLQNRLNTTSTVTAQRLMDLMIAAGVGSTTLVDNTGTFPCGALNPCQLGGGGGVVGDFTTGSPLFVTGQINFGAAKVPGFNISYRDPNDASGIPYDVRWAVVTSVRNMGPLTGVVVAKRFVVGVRRENGQNPVTLVSWATR